MGNGSSNATVMFNKIEDASERQTDSKKMLL